MPRLMSVAYTEDAVIERRKTVTRRRGWLFLRPGDRLTLCRKVQGRRRADGSVEPLVRLAEAEVIDVRRQSLARLHDSATYAEDEMVREGFPGMDPKDFVRRYFVKAQGMTSWADVTRIEWRYLDQEASC